MLLLTRDDLCFICLSTLLQMLFLKLLLRNKTEQMSLCHTVRIYTHAMENLMGNVWVPFEISDLIPEHSLRHGWDLFWNSRREVCDITGIFIKKAAPAKVALNLTAAIKYLITQTHNRI